MARRTIGRTFGAILAGAALIAGPAMAQTPQQATLPAKQAAINDPNDLSDAQMNELYCIYNAMQAEDATAFAAAILYGEDAKTPKAREVFEKAKTACTTRHQWTKAQADVAAAIASSGLLTNLAESKLTGKGFDERKFEAVLGVVDRMAPADFDEFMHGTDKPGEAMLGRVRKLVVEAGVPEEYDLVELSLTFLRSSLQEYDAAQQWVDEKLY